MFHWEVSQLTIMEEVEAFSVIILGKKKKIASLPLVLGCRWPIKIVCQILQ